MADDVILQTRGLSKNFGQVKAVNDLNVTVNSGSIYGFLGRNGAGKTTTIRMLMGIIAPAAGEITILGEKSRRITKKQKQMIGYVSQENNFYQWMTCRTIGEFVSGFYPTWDKDEYLRLLKVMELPLDRKISALSGGMKVKSALALALAYRPKLLILDEPTSGLDPAARKEFLNIIAHQARKYGRTTFFSSHIIGEVEQISSHISIIDQGKKKYEGCVNELKNRVKKIVLSGWTGGTGTASALLGFLFEHINEEFRNTLDPAKIEVLSASVQEDRGELLIHTDFTGWEQNLSPGAVLFPMSLEDIFISLTEKDVVL